MTRFRASAEARVLAADRFEVLHRADMATRSTRGLTRSSIVAAQGRLLVRTPDRLYCLAK
jgi:hypothetical protein